MTKFDVLIYVVVVIYFALLGGALAGENASFEARYVPIFGAAVLSAIGCLIGNFARKMVRRLERESERKDLLGLQIMMISMIVSSIGFMAVGYGYKDIGMPLFVAGFIPVIPAAVLRWGAVFRKMREK